MANIRVNLSQLTVNTQDTLRAQNAQSPLVDDIDIFFQASHVFNLSHTHYTSSATVGASARINFADGGYSIYSGLIDANPSASSGTATASNVEDYFPGAFRMAYAGRLDYSYATQNGSTSFVNTGGIVSDIVLQTILPTSSPGYSALLGNAALSLHGSIALASDQSYQGVVNILSGHTDRFISSQTTTGNFHHSGNVLSVGQGLTTSQLSGELQGFNEQYADGSFIDVSAAQVPVSPATMLDQRLLADPSNFPANDSFNIRLPASISTPWLIASGAGNDQVTIQGGGAALSVNAGSGNDSITLGDHGHAADGGSGADTAIFAGPRAAYLVSKTASGYTVQASSGGPVDTLSNVERLQFADTSVAYDISGNGGQAYRLYQAAFDRAPDAVGLGYWMQALDNGATLAQVANQFMSSREFNDLYGSNLSNAAFVGQLYQNVLHRAGDPAGADYWTKALGNGAARADLLASFGESGENQAALALIIGNGFSFTHYG